MKYDFTNNPNVYIFEGIDFSGKTTVSKRFSDKLKESYGENNVVWLRSPGGSPMAEQLRDKTRSQNLNIYEQADAYLTCFEHTISYLDSIMRTKDAIFVIDRWTASYHIYQYREIQKDTTGYMHVDIETHKALETRYRKILNYNFGSSHKPMHFNMLLSNEEYLKRKIASANRGESKDRFEDFTTEKQLGILEEYRRLTDNSAFFLRYSLCDIDVNGKPEQVNAIFDSIVADYINQPKLRTLHATIS